MINKFCTTLLLSGLSFSLYAADNYRIDSRHTFPSFEINHLGFSTQRGRFNQTTGTVVIDTKSKTGGSIEVSIDSASIDTGLAELETHLRGDDFLAAAKFKTIDFKSTQLQFTGEQLIGVEGNLHLHGISKPVHLTIDAFHCGMNLIKLVATCGANATTTIKRSDFGVDKYVPMIGDEVKISIQIEAIKE